MVKLSCENCGAPLEVEDSSVFVGDGGDIVIVRSGHAVECGHCGTKYLPGEEMQTTGISQSVTIVGNGNVVSNVTQTAGKYAVQIRRARGVVIGNGVSQSVIITGDDVHIP